MTDKNLPSIGGESNMPNGIPAEFAEIASICTATEVMIGGQMVIGVADARDLHAGLGVGRDYTNWIKGRITKYGFREGVDYEVFAETGENSAKEYCSPELASKKDGRGGRNALTYRLTLDTAKELAMVENNEKGRIARRYFIWCEAQANKRHVPMDALTAKETGGIVKAVVVKQMAEVRQEIDHIGTALVQMSHLVRGLVLAADGRVAALEYVSVRELLDEAKAVTKGRNRINRRIGHDLRVIALTRIPPVPLRRCPHSGVWLFPRDFAAAYMAERGRAMVAEHNDKAAKQGVLFTIVPKSKALRPVGRPRGITN